MASRLTLVLITVLAVTGCSETNPEWAAAPTPSQTASAAATTPPPSPSMALSCHGFPADNVWRADVSRLPVHQSSAAFIASIGATTGLHPDFGAGQWESAPIGIPVTTIPSGQAGVKVGFEYSRESDPGPYPIPADARVEGGRQGTGDRHIILHDPAGCRVYELYAAYPAADGAWRAGSGAIFDLRSNKLRPAGWTSADAAGLSIYAGLVRYEEVAAGRIDHAIRITVPRTRNAYVWPARHAASQSADPAMPPMGLRLRLKSDVDTSKFPAQARVIADAMKKYGVIIADNGSAWYVSGEPDDRWSNDALRVLKQLHGNNFEAVDSSSLMVAADSGAVR